MRDNQTNKKALQAKEKARPQAEQATEKPERSKKSEKARKKKKKNQRNRQEQREGSTPVSGTNAVSIGKKKNGQNVVGKQRTLARSPATTMIKKTIMLTSVLKQKNSCSLGNLHVSDC